VEEQALSPEHDLGPLADDLLWSLAQLRLCPPSLVGVHLGANSVQCGRSPRRGRSREGTPPAAVLYHWWMTPHGPWTAQAPGRDIPRAWLLRSSSGLFTVVAAEGHP